MITKEVLAAWRKNAEQMPADPPSGPRTRERILELIGEVEWWTDESKKNAEAWKLYEKEFILPCFQWAKEAGIDLPALVSEAKGNCVERLVRALIEQRDQARASGHSDEEAPRRTPA